MKQLHYEKKASNLLIQSTLNEARVSTAEAISLIDQTKKDKRELEYRSNSVI